MTMTLYDHPLSPFATRNRIQIRAKGLDGQIRIEPRPDMTIYRRISATGKLPALDNGEGVVLIESETIAEYIEDRFPLPSLRGRSAETAALVRLLPRLLDLYFLNGVGILDAQVKAGTAEPARVADGLALVDKGLSWIANYLPERGYAVEQRLTLADCALASGLFFIMMTQRFGRTAFEGHDRIRSYYEWVNAKDPHCAAAHREMSEALDERLRAAAKG